MKNKNKILNIFKFLIAHCFKPILKFERKFIYKKHAIKKRLFSTTGNISLVNTLAMLKQIDNTNCEDYLIINSGGNAKFWECNNELAKLHNFKKIIKIANIRYSTGFILKNLFDFDEVYTINHPDHLDIINEIFKNTPINLIDEGIGSLINYKCTQNTNYKHFYTNRYIDKFDGLGFSEQDFEKFEYIKVENFREIAKFISEKYPIEPKINPNDKNILYCGIFWTISGLDKETFIQEQNKQINELLEAGYKILYKPHPRDTEFYGLDDNPNVTIINSYLPVELYDWNIIALTAMSCSTVIHLAHYNNIPCFSNVSEKAASTEESKINIGLIRNFIREYSPNYKLLLDLDVKNITTGELKQQAKLIYKDFVKSLPMLSDHQNIKHFMEEHRAK